MVEPINKADLKSINKATEQIHVAAQFLAMAGKFLTEPREDDSHTNLGWMSMKEKFISRPFGEGEQYFITLHPENLRLGFLDGHNHIMDRIPLEGMTQKDGVKWLKVKLTDLNIKGAEQYGIDLHYDMPNYANFKEKKFKISSQKANAAFSKLRSWGDHFVNKYKLQFPEASETRTWPHHFDHATYIPLTHLEGGEVSKSINLGLAIHDGMIDEPYFYVSAWIRNEELDLMEAKSLSWGYWLNDGFKGAVLPIYDILEIADFGHQMDAIDIFFEETLSQILNLIDYTPIDADAEL